MWKKIPQHKFDSSGVEDLSLVAMGDLYAGGKFREYAKVGGRQEDAIFRTQDIDGILSYWEWVPSEKIN